MAHRSFVQRFLLCGLLTLLLAACASAPPVTKIQGSIQTAAGLNPDASGRPSPVVLRVYELRSPSAFQNADFFALYDKDAATLGQDMLIREELELQPGQSREYNKDLQGDTRYVGVMAAFRNIDEARWRGVVEVPKGESSSLTIQVDSLSVSITRNPR